MDTHISHNFNKTLAQYDCFPLTRSTLSELQINLGYLCNQACEHCHVEAGPKRTEMMIWETMAKILAWAKHNNIKVVDLTGGAPELIPDFRRFVDHLIAADISVTCRCNITVLFEPGQQDLAQWYAARNIRLVCSLPCYSEKNVDQQRGKGVFRKSIAGLQLLNQVGYGRDLTKNIDLVYNPIGTNLPPSQRDLEAQYKTRLKRDFDIDFNGLLTITNLPINRFEHYLKRTNQLDSYIQLLADNFNPQTVAPLMCRHLLSVDWQGYVYDCDFNQMLNLPLGQTGDGAKRQLWEIQKNDLEQAPIAVGKHCYGCTAGAGSSCGGALT